MGSSASVPKSDARALKNGYDFMMKNQASYDRLYVAEVSLLFGSTIPAEFLSQYAPSHVSLSKEQHESYKKLRNLLSNPIVKPVNNNKNNV